MYLQDKTVRLSLLRVPFFRVLTSCPLVLRLISTRLVSPLTGSYTCRTTELLFTRLKAHMKPLLRGLGTFTGAEPETPDTPQEVCTK